MTTQMTISLGNTLYEHCTQYIRISILFGGAEITSKLWYPSRFYTTLLYIFIPKTVEPANIPYAKYDSMTTQMTISLGNTLYEHYTQYIRISILFGGAEITQNHGTRVLLTLHFYIYVYPKQ
jgi:hypothetical protein